LQHQVDPPCADTEDLRARLKQKEMTIRRLEADIADRDAQIKQLTREKNQVDLLNTDLKIRLGLLDEPAPPDEPDEDPLPSRSCCGGPRHERPTSD